MYINAKYGVFLSRLEPPYREFIPHAEADQRLIVPGTIMALRVGDELRSTQKSQAHPLRDRVAALQREYSQCPLILRLERECPANAANLAHAAGRCGVRAVHLEGESLTPALRMRLTDPTLLADDVVQWLSALRILPRPPALRILIHQIIARAPQHDTVCTLLDELCEPHTSVRFRMRKYGFPSPSQWHQLARAQHALLRLQRHPEAPLMQAALQFGYSDQSALSQQFLRTFGVRPGSARGLLGWEWAMSRWLHAKMPAHYKVAA